MFFNPSLCCGFYFYPIKFVREGYKLVREGDKLLDMA